MASGVEVRTDSRLVEVEAAAGRVHSILLADGQRLTADAFVDATADGVLAAMAGCELRYGRDGYHEFAEPSAPLQPDDQLNGVTQLCRIRPLAGGEKRIEPLPDDIPATCWWTGGAAIFDGFPAAMVNAVPNGDRIVNMLPTMSGREHRELGSLARSECQRRARAHWHFLQRRWPEFQSYRLHSLAPALGIREGARIVAERTLTQHDLLSGLSAQQDDDIIALADHGMDTHGHATAYAEVRFPYGIPFGCLIPRGWRNLLVAGRGAGFSSLAASSCRLTRTMMQLGQAAGTAIALARRSRNDPATVNRADLRTALSRQGVQLQWPMERHVRQRVGAESGWSCGDDHISNDMLSASDP